jgi:hypothetical protein
MNAVNHVSALLPVGPYSGRLSFVLAMHHEASVVSDLREAPKHFWAELRSETANGRIAASTTAGEKRCGPCSERSEK